MEGYNVLFPIGYDAFAGCEHLEVISIPASLKAMTTRNFSFCPLKTIYSHLTSLPTLPSWNQGAVFDQQHFTDATLYVPKGRKQLFSTAEVWKNFVDIQEMDYDNITTTVVDREVTSVYYLNAHGTVSDVPFKGFNICVKTYNDGSSSVEKINK